MEASNLGRQSRSERSMAAGGSAAGLVGGRRPATPKLRF
jgi:hypothetical protein